MGISSQGWAYGILKQIKGAKIRTRNRNVIETRMGQGGSKVRVPVRGCTECNSHRTSAPYSQLSPFAYTLASLETYTHTHRHTHGQTHMPCTSVCIRTPPLFICLITPIHTRYIMHCASHALNMSRTFTGHCLPRLQPCRRHVLDIQQAHRHTPALSAQLQLSQSRTTSSITRVHLRIQHCSQAHGAFHLRAHLRTLLHSMQHHTGTPITVLGL